MFLQTLVWTKVIVKIFAHNYQNLCVWCGGRRHHFCFCLIGGWCGLQGDMSWVPITMRPSLRKPAGCDRKVIWTMHKFSGSQFVAIGINLFAQSCSCLIGGWGWAARWPVVGAHYDEEGDNHNWLWFNWTKVIVQILRISVRVMWWP